MKYIVFWWLLALWIEWSFGQVSPTNHWFISGTENSTITTITGDWKQANNSFTSNRPPFLQLRSTLKGQILTNFRAYMFYLYISRPVGSSVSVWLDGKRSTFPFKPQNQSSQRVVLSNGIEDMFVMEGEIGSADHQLLIDASSNSEEHPVIFDRIEMETPDNTPSPLPMNYTTVATSVPAGETVDDVSDSLNYSESGWERKEHPFFYGNSSSVTTTPGSWVQLTFVGTGIWVYGAIPVEGVVFSVEAIRKYGRETTREITTHNFTLPDLEVPIYQAPLLAHSELTYANAYIYNITLISGSMQLDFIR
ncbi:hypothetical protein FRB91_003590 [Serendipita sp. 411]|nr:hypothetical protein FRC18_003995 [Serendipita sp. 400]KAG8843119.1 hypothetical protein FRB91_003590 [Serendipita sp. 411]